MAKLSDSLRDRWEGISPRERRLVVILLVAVPVTLLILLGSQIQDGLAAIETRNARVRKALVVVGDLRARGAPAAPKDDPSAAITTTPIELPIYLNAAAEKIGLTIPSFNKQPEVTRDGFVTSLVRIDLRDLNVTQLTDFLAAVEANRAVAVTGLTVTRNFRDKEKLDAKLDVAAYHREGAPADAGGSADGSGSGAAPAEGG